jgi:hypothetical protein
VVHNYATFECKTLFTDIVDFRAGFKINDILVTDLIALIKQYAVAGGPSSPIFDEKIIANYGMDIYCEFSWLMVGSRPYGGSGGGAGGGAGDDDDGDGDADDADDDDDNMVPVMTITIMIRTATPHLFRAVMPPATRGKRGFDSSWWFPQMPSRSSRPARRTTSSSRCARKTPARSTSTVRPLKHKENLLLL